MKWDNPLNKGDISLTELSNGIRIISDHMSSVETISLGAWFGVGTRNENSNENGVAHLLEHMAFKGTERRSATDIAEEIESVGGHLNAYTSREQTAYYAKILKSDLDLAVDILSDILQNAVFDENELARERAVVLQEIGQAADTPDDIIFDLFQHRAYPDQPIGRPVLGKTEFVSKMPRRTIVDFVEKHYGGNQLVFSAAGNAEHQRLVEIVESKFEHLKRTKPIMLEPATYVGGDCREARELEQIHLVIGFPSVDFNHPDFYAQQVLSMLLGGGMSSRLFQEVREKRGLAYSIYSFSAAYRDGGLFGIYAGTGEREVTELLPVICDQLTKLTKTDLEEEVIRSRTQLKSGLLMSREGTSNRCEQIAQHMLVFGKVMSVNEIIDKVNGVDVESVQRVAERLLNGIPTMTAIGPISHLESYESFRSRLRL